MATVLVRLPEEVRGELKNPMGPIYTDGTKLVATVDGPLVTVGDVVTYHVQLAGTRPQVAVIDRQTERTPVEATIAEALGSGDVIVENPAATITEDLVRALVEGLASEEPVTILVEGEEDLATLPAILAVPEGGSVVYGQPGEGMVHVRVTAAVKEEVRALLHRFTGDPARLVALVA
jgi:uncharacterized protein (UPF0218 family)